MQVFELEMGRDDVGIRIVCRVLHRGEVVDFVFARHDDDAAGMLTCRALDAETAGYQPVDFRTVDGDTLVLQIVDRKAVCRFVRKGADRTCLERLAVTEQHLCESMCVALYIAGEVQVDIRRFVALEPKEGLKRNIVTVLRKAGTAIRAVLRRHIETGTPLLPLVKFRIAAFRTAVMRRQWMDSGDA